MTEPGTAAAPEKLVGALASGLSVLRYLTAAAAPVGVSRVARDLGLHSSTCFNLLKTLVHERLVQFDEATKTYAITLGVVELARGALEQKSYVRMIRPHLDELALRHRVTVTLWHRTLDERVVLIDRADNAAAVRVYMSIGQRLPMWIAALGRVIAAHSDLTVAQLKARFRALRWEEPLDFETYLAEVEEARRVGYAVDVGHFSRGITAVSAAVIDAAGQPLMAISPVGISAQLDRAAIRALGQDLRARTAEISRAMSGGTGALPLNGKAGEPDNAARNMDADTRRAARR
ncbi:MAG TPA: IclR family transcriptional regulator [Burkholderiaceae bacterium]|nr:IclR family transcriptional regulator [Burkholderiaceae bacterium]